MQGGVTGRREIVEDAALLLAQGVAHREQALREATAVGTVAAETGVAPQHAMAKLVRPRCSSGNRSRPCLSRLVVA